MEDENMQRFHLRDGLKLSPPGQKAIDFFSYFEIDITVLNITTILLV